MNKDIIKRNFSRCAPLYDRYANIQRLAADGLIKELPDNGITHILEIGCGTGNYTGLLVEKFKTAKIKALDISEGMIKIARKKLPRDQIEFMVTDAEMMHIDNEFSLITSNVALQWFENLPLAIAKYKKALTKEGIFTFSIFGPLTFLELSQSLQEALQEKFCLSAYSFLEKEELGVILESIFRKVSINERIVKERYISLVELLRKIKYTGSRGEGVGGSFLWSQRLLSRTEEIYKAKFGEIRASYQIFFCKTLK